MASLNSNTRVTVSEVKEIYDTDMSDATMKQFINMAAEIVDEISDADSDLTTQRLSLIEMNVAAHYASSLDPRVAEEQAGDIRQKYKGDPEKTEYWRTAKSLDPTGQLTLEHRPRAMVHVLDSRNIE